MSGGIMVGARAKTEDHEIDPELSPSCCPLLYLLKSFRERAHPDPPLKIHQNALHFDSFYFIPIHLYYFLLFICVAKSMELANI